MALARAGQSAQAREFKLGHAADTVGFTVLPPQVP